MTNILKILLPITTAVLITACGKGDDLSKIITPVGNTILVSTTGFEDDTPIYNPLNEYKLGDIVRINDYIYEMLPAENTIIDTSLAEQFDIDRFIVDNSNYKEGNLFYEDGKYYMFTGKNIVTSGILICLGRPANIAYPYDLYYYGNRLDDTTFIKECECNEYANGIKIITKINENNTITISTYNIEASNNCTEELVSEETKSFNILKNSASGANIGDLVVIDDKLFEINNNINLDNTHFFKKVDLIPVKLYEINKFKPFDDMNLTKAKFKANDEITFKTDTNFDTILLSGIMFNDEAGNVEVYINNNLETILTIESTNYTTIYYTLDKTTTEEIKLKFTEDGEVGTLKCCNVVEFGVADLEVEHNPLDYNNYSPNKLGYIEESTKPILNIYKVKLYFSKDNFSKTVETINKYKGKFIAFDITENHPLWQNSVLGCIIVNPTTRVVYKTLEKMKKAQYVECNMTIQEIV